MQRLVLYFKSPRHKREEVSGTDSSDSTDSSEASKRSALLCLPHNIYFLLDFAKTQVWLIHKYLQAGPIVNGVIPPNSRTNIVPGGRVWEFPLVEVSRGQARSAEVSRGPPRSADVSRGQPRSAEVSRALLKLLLAKFRRAHSSLHTSHMSKPLM